MSADDSSFREYTAASLGATAAFGERFTLYVPNKGRSENDQDKQTELPDWESWIRRAVDLLAKINGGATAAAPATGLYIDKQRGDEEVWERTAVVYSFVDRQAFRKHIGEVREFIHEFGRETRQGAVFFEFDGFAYEVNPPYNSSVGTS